MERWGDTYAYRQSKARTAQYTSADFNAAKRDQEAATELFVSALRNHLAPTSGPAQEAVNAHRAAISKWFYNCSVEMRKNLTVMHIEDPRFKEYFDGCMRGLAQHVPDANTAQ
jgi:hypothetical protein